jgi:hypothetical protein
MSELLRACLVLMIFLMLYQFSVRLNFSETPLLGSLYIPYMRGVTPQFLYIMTLNFTHYFDVWVLWIQHWQYVMDCHIVFTFLAPLNSSPKRWKLLGVKPGLWVGGYNFAGRRFFLELLRSRWTCLISLWFCLTFFLLSYFDTVDSDTIWWFARFCHKLFHSIQTLPCIWRQFSSSIYDPYLAVL